MSEKKSEVQRLTDENMTLKRKLAEAGKFMEPFVFHTIMTDGVLPYKDGARIHASFLFSDIEGFTSYSERLEPENVLDVINVQMEAMCRIIGESKGTVDNTMGDAIVAIFGLEGHKNHAEQAIRAAIEMQHEMDRLQKSFSDLNAPGLVIRIGINTGDAVVGYVGAQGALNFTAIGDPVNVASRLEGRNKEFGSKILIGGQTYEEAYKAFDEDTCTFESVGKILVKGKTKKIEAFTVSDY